MWSIGRRHRKAVEVYFDIFCQVYLAYDDFYTCIPLLRGPKGPVASSVQ